MTFKCLVLFSGLFLLGIGWSVAAQAADYNLVGGGAQYQIGGGLPLPIQTVMTSGGAATNTGTQFPPLLVPIVAGKTIMGTTMMSTGQQLTIPPTVLSKKAAQLTLGQFGQNPSLYAVATNLQFRWPHTTVVLNTTLRTGSTTTTFTTVGGSNIRYSNALARKFGGPAQFRVTPGAPSGLMPAVPVTIYGIGVPGPGNPPCIHTALTPLFGTGGNPACVAGIAQALPTTTGTSLAVLGGPVSNTMTTAGGTPVATAAGGPVPGVGVGKFGPNGTVSQFFYTPNSNPGFTNAATTVGFPWTTGMLTISAPGALGAPEIFTITGMDNRTANGAGSIQLVAGGAGQRTLSGPNANRGWVRLQLSTDAPAASPGMLAGGAGLILLAFGYAGRRLAANKKRSE